MPKKKKREKNSKKIRKKENSKKVKEKNSVVKIKEITSDKSELEEEIEAGSIDDEELAKLKLNQMLGRSTQSVSPSLNQVGVVETIEQRVEEFIPEKKEDDDEKLYSEKQRDYSSQKTDSPRKYTEPSGEMGGQTIKAERVDMQTLGRQPQTQTRGVDFTNPEARNINSGKLEQDYVKAERMDMQTLGKEQPTHREYKMQ